MSGTRQNILVAAGEVIADVGLEKVRMRMVAEHAGVSTGLLHYHFDNREKLFHAAMLHCFEHVAEADYVADPPPGAPPATWRLARYIDVQLPTSAELDRFFRLWRELLSRASHDEDSRLLTVELFRQLREWIAELIREGTATGEFTAADPDRTADLVLALTEGYAERLVIEDPAVTFEAARTDIWNVLRDRLGLKGDQPARPL
ncbi:TetR/AcrR family transcriptional regulator [Streptomyces sp. FIT100]|uniref:TetR/AcrR family transcriptional regulator n=1 Tax=Streptomyces sp. FIT100 TaxID=2837956 RepID=UPI0021C6EE44|nr:TetR/AcrR family transcriptional regulator [Streptomyces sp. FIT100]UUN30916.1 TetR/AcrR family transcriptional regulator [Streptomyces sp. FIT100]